MAECIRSTDLLLIPGMMCDARMWQAQIDALSNQIRIHPCEMVGDSVKKIAEQILASAPDSFALAGLSMGAIVSFEIWRQAPKRVERMALMDTNFRADTAERKQLRNRQIEQVAAGGLEEILRDELKPNYLAQLHRNDMELLDRVLEMGMSLGEQAFFEQSVALRDRPDSSATLASIDCPVVTICGDEDQLCPVSLHREMTEKIGGAELHIVDHCGHLSTMEQPQEVNKILVDWLRS